MIRARKKQYILVSLLILFVCFMVIVLSLFQLSSISHELEREHQRYLTTFTNFYANLLQENINNFVEQVDLLTRRITPEQIQLFTQLDGSQSSELSDAILDFFRLTDSVNRVEITYLDSNNQLWLIKVFTVGHESDLYNRMIRTRHLIINPKEKTYLENWFYRSKNQLEIYPLMHTSSREQILSDIVLPLSYSLYSEDKVTAKIKFFFNAEYLSKNIRDFKEVSGSLIQQILIVLQDGQILMVDDVHLPAIRLYQGEPHKGLYSNWPLFTPHEVREREESLNQISGPASSTDGYLEIFRINQTQEFWGLFLQISQDNFLRPDDSFFLPLSALVLSVSFIFCSFYYTASYFYTQDIRKILEKDLLENAMQFDPLTGSLTRVACQKKATQMILEEKIFTLAVLDIDFFKQVNDQYGHIVGDQVLIDMSHRIRYQFSLWQELYPSSLFSFSRWGGEEFILLLRTKDKNLVPDLLMELQKVISTPSEVKDIPPYTISLGYSTVNYTVRRREPSETFKFLFKEADLALYDAKQAGRNQTRAYTSSEENNES